MKTRAGLLSFDPEMMRKLEVFSLARLLLLGAILMTTIFLRQEVLGANTIIQIYATLLVSFFITFINVSFWEETAKVRYFIPSQLLFDVLLTSYLVYLTGINDSIFLFLYLFNIVFSSITYQLNGSLSIAGISGVVYGLIYMVNVDTDNANAVYNLAYNELLFLLTALLAGQLMDELKKQKLILEQQRANIARLELLNDELLNNLPVGILVIDRNAYIRNINKTALDLLQLSSPPSVRLKYGELLPNISGVPEGWDKLTEHQRLRFQFQHSINKSTKKKLSLQVKPYPGDSSQSILVLQDVSKLTELEERLEVDSRLAATGQLAAGIAHEIRNPLASISGSIETLGAHLRIDNEEDKKLISISLREIKRLNQLITDFLEFAKPKDSHSEQFRLRDKVEEVCEAIETRSKDGKKVQFELNIPADLELELSPERLKQIFFNLFINAVEASQSDSVKIEVSCEEAEEELKILIKDNGPGVPPDLTKKIFDPFFTTKPSGTGLGLSTVAQIVKSMKGSVSLVSGDSGACFEIKWPRSASHSLAKTGS